MEWKERKLSLFAVRISKIIIISIIKISGYIRVAGYKVVFGFSREKKLMGREEDRWVGWVDGWMN